MRTISIITMCLLIGFYVFFALSKTSSAQQRPSVLEFWQENGPDDQSGIPEYEKHNVYTKGGTFYKAKGKRHVTKRAHTVKGEHVLVLTEK